MCVRKANPLLWISGGCSRKTRGVGIILGDLAAENSLIELYPTWESATCWIEWCVRETGSLKKKKKKGLSSCVMEIRGFLIESWGWKCSQCPVHLSLHTSFLGKEKRLPSASFLIGGPSICVSEM